MSKNNQHVLNDIHNEILAVANEKFAENVCIYFIKDSSWVTECVIILGAKNTVHCKTLTQSISSKLESLSSFSSNDDYFNPVRQAGSPQSGWMILDINSILIYVMLEETRAFYRIDDLFEEKAITIHPNMDSLKN